MHMRKLTCLILLLLLCSAPLRAQWSGGVDLSAGFGGMKSEEVNQEAPMFHGLTQGVFLLNYKTDKFSWTNRVDGKWEPKTTENTRIAYKNEQLGIVYKASGAILPGRLPRKGGLPPGSCTSISRTGAKTTPSP